MVHSIDEGCAQDPVIGQVLHIIKKYYETSDSKQLKAELDDLAR